MVVATYAGPLSSRTQRTWQPGVVCPCSSPDWGLASFKAHIDLVWGLKSGNSLRTEPTDTPYLSGGTLAPHPRCASTTSSLTRIQARPSKPGPDSIPTFHPIPLSHLRSYFSPTASFGDTDDHSSRSIATAGWMGKRWRDAPFALRPLKGEQLPRCFISRRTTRRVWSGDVIPV